jgi:pimeloyl-ACP methyl ester carboxylesterase
MAIWSEKPLGDPAWLRDVTMFVRQEPVAGAGHFFQLEQPAITNALLRAFLDDIARDPRVSSP